MRILSKRNLWEIDEGGKGEGGGGGPITHHADMLILFKLSRITDK